MNLVKLNKSTLKEIGYRQTYDLEIDDKNHNFILDNGIVTSNSHSYSYAYLAMQTLYLKMYYPEEFYATALTSNGNESMFAQYITDAMKRGIKVTQPSILHSTYGFKPVAQNLIACGFKLVKGIGPKAYDELISSPRNWTTLSEFLLHPWSKFNKSAIEASIKCGALKELEPNTKLALELAQYHLENKANLDKLNRKKEIKYSKEMLEQRYQELKDGNFPDFTDREMDNFWKDVTGFSYPFRNKFMEYIDGFREYGVVPATSWNDRYTLVYGEIIKKEEVPGKNGIYWRLTLNDGFGDIRCKVWGNQIKATKDMDKVKDGSLICIELSKDNYGYTFSRNGRFLVLAE